MLRHTCSWCAGDGIAAAPGCRTERLWWGPVRLNSTDELIHRIVDAVRSGEDPAIPDLSTALALCRPARRGLESVPRVTGQAEGHLPGVTSLSAEQPVTVPMMTARWLSQAFVHWPYPPVEVQALLPGGLQADVFRNAAWVGVTPFLMASVKVLGVVPVPVSTFTETNVRTYARLPDGKDGVWFLSIDVSNPVMLAARAIGAPYHVGNLKIRTDGPVIHYTGERRGGGPHYRLTVRTGAPAEVTELDIWLTSRWRSFTRRAGLIWETPVEHEPWPLVRGTIIDLQENATSAGLSAPVGEPIVHFSSWVGPVRLGATRLATRASFRSESAARSRAGGCARSSRGPGR